MNPLLTHSLHQHALHTHHVLLAEAERFHQLRLARAAKHPEAPRSASRFAATLRFRLATALHRVATLLDHTAPPTQRLDILTS